MAYTYLAKVVFFDEVKDKMDQAVHILAAYSFADASKQLEDAYGDTIEKVHLTVYDEGLPTFPVDMYTQLDEILSGQET